MKTGHLLKKINAAFCCHTHRLRRVLWQQIFEPLDARLPSPRVWRMAQLLLHLPVARNPAASFAIVTGIIVPLAIEGLASEFSCAVISPGTSRHGRTSGAPLHPSI